MRLIKDRKEELFPIAGYKPFFVRKKPAKKAFLPFSTKVNAYK
jgi:hypothetical protein